MKGSCCRRARQCACLVTLEGCGHGLPARDPVKVNQLIREFVCPPPPAARWTRSRARPKRAVYVSSPIGIGHVRRDISIADELATGTDAEQNRARYPDAGEYVDRDGVRILWERYGDGDPTVLFLPTWEIVHSRAWKCQIPYFSRHFRVVTFDPRGNGRSDRPRDVLARGEALVIEHIVRYPQVRDRAIFVGDPRGHRP
jgi:hypothetical protein